MAKGWYVRHDDRVIGPFPAAKLKQLFRAGRLTASDSLSKDSPDGPWREAGSISALFPGDDDLVGSEDRPSRKQPQPPVIQPDQPSSGSAAKIAVLSILGTLLVVGLGTGVYFLTTGDPNDSSKTIVAKQDAVENTSVDSTEATDNQPTGTLNGDPDKGSSEPTGTSAKRPLDVVAGSGPAEVKSGPSDKANLDSATDQTESSIGQRPKVSRAEEASIREATKRLNHEYLDQNTELVNTLAGRDEATQAENTQFITKLLLEPQPKAITLAKLAHRLPATRMDAIRKSRNLKGRGAGSPVKALMAHLYKRPPPAETTGVVYQMLRAFEDFQDVQAMPCIVDLRTYLNKLKTEQYRGLRLALRPAFKKSVETRLLPMCDLALEKVIVGGGRYVSDWKQFDLTCELALTGTEGQKKRGRISLIKIARIGASHHGTAVYSDLKRNLDRCRSDEELSALLRATIVQGLKVGASSASKEFDVSKTLIRAYKENVDSAEIVKTAVAEFTHMVTRHAATKGIASYTDIEPLYLENPSDKGLSGPAVAAVERALNLSAISEGLEMYPLFRHVGGGKGGLISLYFKASETPVLVRTGSHSDDTLRAAARTATKRLGPLPEFADEWVAARNRMRVLPSGKTVVLKDDGFKLKILSGKATVFRIIDSDSMLCESTFVERSKKARLFKVSGYSTNNLADEDSVDLHVCTIGSIKLGDRTLLHCIPSVVAKSPLRYAEYADYKSGSRQGIDEDKGG